MPMELVSDGSRLSGVSDMFDVCVAGFVGVVRGRERGGEGCVCGRVTCKWFRTKVNWGEG